MTEAQLQANRVNGALGGRPKSYKQSQTAKLNSQFLKHSPEALDCLVWHMRHCENPAIRVAASREILDRALGRPVRSIDRAAGQIMDMLTVITGVPRPEPDVIEQIEQVTEIEGEVVNSRQLTPEGIE